MELTYQGVKLKQADSEEYKVAAMNANFKAAKERITTDYEAFEKKHKQIRKNSIIKAKEELVTHKIKKVGLKDGYKQELATLKIKQNKELANLKAKSQAAHISNEVELLKEGFDKEKELITHKFAGNENKIQAETEKVNAREAKAIEKANQYLYDSEKYEAEKAAIVEKYNVLRNELEKVFKADQEKETEAILSLKTKTKENVSEAKARLKSQKDTRKDKRNELIKQAKVDAAAAKEYIQSSNIFVNYFYEPIINEATEKSGEKVVIEKSEKIDNNEKFAKQKNKILNLKWKHDVAVANSNDTFDQKAKIIDLGYQVTHNENVLKIMEAYDSKISDAQEELDKVIANTNKKLLVENQKADIKDKKEAYKAEVSRIKADFSAGKFSKESKKNSLRIAKDTLKSDSREVKLSNELLAASEKLRFLKIEKATRIKKEYNLMNSLIDDALRNVPTTSTKNQRWFAAAMSFVLPGAGQILNKQYIKGALLFVLSAFIYGVLLPIAAGWISFKGAGVGGLGILSPAHSNIITGTYYDDARFRIVEGIIAIFAIVIGFTSLIIASKDAYQFGKAMELGIRAKNGRALKKFFKTSGLPYLLSIPAAVAILFIVILPLATTILLAFTNYQTGHVPPGNALSWAGFHNFETVFKGGYAESFGFVAVWTLIWTVTVSIGVIGLGTFLALLVDQKRVKGKWFWKIVFILPWAVPAFATILFFSAATDNGGLYNQLFNVGTNFKQSTDWTRAFLILIQIWLGHSYIFLLMTGVKKSISTDFFEAASIDGASAWTQFWKISAPIIMFQIAPLLIGQIVFNFNNYGIIWMFNDGGPQSSQALMGNPGSTDIFLSLIFKMTTSGTSNRVALASAFTIVISIAVVLVSAIGFLRSNSFKEEI